MEIINKKDFIEIEFTGKTKEGEIFDSNIQKDMEKMHPDAKAKPFVFCIGEGMFLDAIDSFLIGKEVGKGYEIELVPEKSFGKRDPHLVKIIPLKIFREKNANPYHGMVFNFDGNFGKILSVSGGRVITDFNNPLAGKDVEYDFTIKKIVSDNKEKVNAIQRFIFGKEFEFEIDEAKKKIIFSELQLMPILNAFKEKFKELLGFDVEILAKPKKEEAKEKKAEKNKDALEKPEMKK